MDLSWKRVLITGASGGLGHALAREFAAAGAKLVLHGRRQALLHSLAGELGAEVIVADLTDRAQLDELMQATETVDVVVANAGLGGNCKGHLMTESDLDAMIDVNLRVPMQMARYYGSRMARRGSGHLVFVGSMAAKATAAGAEAYSATKAGLRVFAFGLHESLAPEGVGVTVVLPGFISDAGMFAEHGGTVPFFVGMVTPEQVAEATRRGVEDDRVEVISSSLPVRIGGQLAHMAPRVASIVATRTPLGNLAPD